MSNDKRGTKSPGQENDGSKNFTPHQSELNEEGRRNKPKDMSPKKLKKKHSEKHVADVEIVKEMGAFVPFLGDLV